VDFAFSDKTLQRTPWAIEGLLWHKYQGNIPAAYSPIAGGIHKRP
jgi:hypothetical protein